MRERTQVQDFKAERKLKYVSSHANKISKDDMQLIYNEHDIEKKRTMVIKIINDFAYKGKQALFLKKVKSTNSTIGLDIIASNLYLFAEGLYV